MTQTTPTTPWRDVREIASSDTNVLKYVFTHPGAVAESVLYKYPTYEKRTEAIRHWTITDHDYEELPNLSASWFIDPPYQLAGRHYRHGSDQIDFARLGRWCQSRRGHVIACDTDAANWLPFSELTVIDGTEGRQKVSRARTELVWLGGGA